MRGYGRKIKMGWYVLLAVSIAVFLTAGGVFTYSMFFEKAAEQESEIEPKAQTELSEPVSEPEQKAEAAMPVLRSFGGEIEWFDGGKWVQLESVEKLEEDDPLTAALEKYMAEKKKTESAGSATGGAEGEDAAGSDEKEDEKEQSAKSEPLSVKSGKVEEKKTTPSKTSEPETPAAPAAPAGPAAPAPPPSGGGKQESDPYL